MTVTPTVTPTVTRRRRQNGTGSISQSKTGYWWARIVLADGRRPDRRRSTQEAALVALQWLLDHYRDELGNEYRAAREGYLFHPEPLREHPPRSGVTRGKRFQVLERDGFRCVYCGATAAEAPLVIDHVFPVADGGSDEIDNLATACWDCNAGKGSRILR